MEGPYVFRTIRHCTSMRRATEFDGSIYNDGTKKCSNSLKCKIRLINEYYSSDDCEFDTNMFTLTITGKYVQQGGHSVYAAPIYNCINYIEVQRTGNLTTESG